MNNKAKKMSIYILTVLVLVIFQLIFSSSYLVKAYYGPSKEMEKNFVVLQEKIMAGSWKEAEAKLKTLNNIWQEIAPKIQISSEQGSINDINDSIARLRGAILTRDKKTSVSELQIIKAKWRRLGN